MLRLNGVFKRHGYWPTLGEAVAADERVFVFVRSKFVARSDHELVREIQVDFKWNHYYYFPSTEKSAIVLSSFKSG